MKMRLFEPVRATKEDWKQQLLTRRMDLLSAVDNPRNW